MASLCPFQSENALPIPLLTSWDIYSIIGSYGTYSLYED